MAKQSKAQQETVERVMHEFAEGELETSAGRKVTSRKQAIAIGLSEAGASNQQTPAQNKRRKGQAERRERRQEPSKAELYERAKKADVPGRSTMSKAELEKALG
ncbi:hypothetical protein KZ820_15750 [Sphingomonas sp. RRHST34]|jgi:hypothetical protein|uniref:Plasmid stabilization protein n=1 Tax=Sphingomonas citri TaxID=2862499 RepID=A0ABS7BRK3_9SPHN|nr:DUF6496 domain-containing protein [Sphingomonas citri]MBW6532196.1 hypothetical protein [Sphingomonas citri]